jgi:L-lactate dehydrogenase (cytochrome)
MTAVFSAARAVNIEDLRRLARGRLPRLVFDYIDGGAEQELTLRENARAFDQVALRPRCAVAHPSYSLRTRVLGHELALPVLLAPLGSSRLFWPLGEVAAARAASAAETVYILSTFAGTPLETVKAAASGPCWYQLYLAGGREVAGAAIARAKAAGYSALVVTIDTPVAGLRERDVRNGVRALLSGRPAQMLPHLAQLLVRPRWLLDFYGDGGLMSFPNVQLAGGPMPYADAGSVLERGMVTWSDLRWIREAWDGPLAVKGVHTAEDARRALDAGAQALVVSNHGGRQLDGVAASLAVLPEVVAAVAGRAEVLFDSGIRRGSDVVKALCLGASAVLVGRAYAYGLGAAGEAGVARALEILRADLLRTLQLLGCAAVAELDASYVAAPPHWCGAGRG